MISLLDFVFFNLAFSVVILGVLINTIEKYLPLFISENFRYGKFAADGSRSSLTLPEFPKSHFRHFYVSAAIISTACSAYVSLVYLKGESAPYWIVRCIDLLCGSDRVPKLSQAATLLSLYLITVQCLRRFYETHFIQVFSDKAKINLTHYVAGHIHYIGCILAILSRSVGFTRSSNGSVEFFDTAFILLFLPATVLFGYAWKNQFESNKILANLRKNDTNKVVSQKYYLPTGGWFDYVSSPHLFFEIVIYVSLTLLLYRSTSWWLVLAWVMSNQIETALLSYWWYKKTFPKFPKERKAVIPFVL